jgi:hypothetical protein
MASAADLERWTAAGGSVEESKAGKRATRVFVAPNGTYVGVTIPAAARGCRFHGLLRRTRAL